MGFRSHLGAPLRRLRTANPPSVDEFLPDANLESLGRPPMNNAEYKAYFSPLMPLFQEFTVTINDLVEDEKENKVVMWAKSTATTAIGPYANEYVIILHMNESGDKIAKFIEFVDSQFSATFFAKLREHLAQQASSA
ncbi:hypothetical protein NPX13_g3131 [Xylaria arbuscula]|uniref:SnoaL-like domain-containing protein n=1 Tax=Xylaria arbuscula TaxID=114810 RepID=A0A9W8TQE6_9PEZI|nr:hypothetical protein NPX13_g3131 [Xylaria arbuscula]